MRIFGLTLIEIIFITCLTGSVSAMGVESISKSHQQANEISLSQLRLAIDSINTQVYAMALVKNKQSRQSDTIEISNVNLPIQYGFVKDKAAIHSLLEQTLIDLGTLARIRDFDEFSYDDQCVVYYEAPQSFGSAANITINEQGC